MVLLVAPDNVANCFCPLFFGVLSFSLSVWACPSRNRSSAPIEFLPGQFEVFPSECAPRALAVFEGPLEILSVLGIFVDPRLDLFKFSRASGVFGFERLVAAPFAYLGLLTNPGLDLFKTTHVLPNYSAR